MGQSASANCKVQHFVTSTTPYVSVTRGRSTVFRMDIPVHVNAKFMDNFRHRRGWNLEKRPDRPSWRPHGTYRSGI